jgi:hypothetical protein
MIAECTWGDAAGRLRDRREPVGEDDGRAAGRSARFGPRACGCGCARWVARVNGEYGDDERRDAVGEPNRRGVESGLCTGDAAGGVGVIGGAEAVSGVGAAAETGAPTGAGIVAGSLRLTQA